MKGTALVTGAGSGIGRAIAMALGQNGMDLVLTGRRLETLRETAALAGGQPVLQPADLEHEEEIRILAGALDGGSEAGRLDVLVHAAGRFLSSTGASATVGEWEAMQRANVWGPWLLTRLLLPRLRTSRGQVLFITSSAGRRPRPGAAEYAATKAALGTLAETLRDEVNRDGVRVTSLFPGRTATPMQAAVHAAENRPWRPEFLLQPEDVAAMAVAALSLPRSAEATEIHLRPMRPQIPAPDASES